MNETPIPKPGSTTEDLAKRRLLNRVAVAALVVVGLLASLVMFDAMYGSRHPVTAKLQPPSVAALVATSEPKPESGMSESMDARGGERVYALQMGVFNNVAGAEDLRARLERHGIASSVGIEARVQIGPFNTPEGVAAASAKLKELGLEGGSPITLKK